MTEKRVLDLGRIDVLAARHDHVLHPVIDEDVTVLVHIGGVAGAHPAVGDRGGGRVGLVPVALHHDRGADQDFPDRASRRLLTVGRDDLELDPRPGSAAGAQLALRRIMIGVREKRASAASLGHAVELNEVAAKAGACADEQIFGDGRGSIGDASHAGQIGAVDARRLHQHLYERGSEERMIDPLLADRVEHELWRGVSQNRRARAARHRDQRDIDAGDVKERHRRQHRVARFVFEAARSGHELEDREIVAVRQLNPFGKAGRARGVELDHVVLRVRFEPRVVRRRGFHPRFEPLVAFAVEAERDQTRPRGDHRDRLVGEIGGIRSDEQDPRAAILEQAGDLRGGEAEVERRERRARLADAEQARQEMIGVLAEIGDPLLRPDARSDECVGKPRGCCVDFREGRGSAIEQKGRRIPAAERLDARHIRHAGDAVELDHGALPPQDRAAAPQTRVRSRNWPGRLCLIMGVLAGDAIGCVQRGGDG